MTRITGIRTHDLRFPTSDMLDGSDAMNPDPDYSVPMWFWKPTAHLKGMA